ncbi:MAG: carbamoyltransferase HypF [Thermoplasmatota archaeon]
MWRILIKGVVQGVGFRPSAVRAARKIGAKGFVRNDGSHVTLFVSEDPETLVEGIRSELGPMGRIEDYEVREMDWPDAGLLEPPDFTILQSESGERDSSLPVDTAICDSCLRELRDPDNRRYRHPFTNCTDCGARFTVIEKLPYDRERTTMSPFEPCGDCSAEYSDISFRRYHAQTLSCPGDGPDYRYLDTRLKEKSRGFEAFLDCARSVINEEFVIIKGWGGMHIVSHPDKLPGLREWYGRKFKPFAMMARDIETARELAFIDEEADKILRSPARPILLLEKNSEAPEWARKGLEHCSPGLGNVGIYLPYSGIHHLLFDALEEEGSDLRWLVMTSANKPGEPMGLELEHVKALGASGYLVHNRRIAARCDDSVLVHVGGIDGSVLRRSAPFGIKALPIRKSRGLVPDPIPLKHRRAVLSLGAERNVSVSVSRKGRVFTSPYIGNSRHHSVLEYAGESLGRLRYLFGADSPEAVVSDMHPRYNTSRLAAETASELSVPHMKYQHHHAHAASLMVDADLEGLGCVVVDGVGYGTDGMPWGGESIVTSGLEWKRAGCLEAFGLPGGDGSVYHPERIAHWLTLGSGHEFSTGSNGTDTFLRASHERAVMTTSFGRILDALSSLMLGVTWRTYDGEPAIRLEALLSSSRSPHYELFGEGPKDGMVPVISRWKVMIDHLEDRGVSELRPGVELESSQKADLAMGFTGALIDDLVQCIVDADPEHKDPEGRSYIGVSGGVAYNVPLVKRFVSSVIECGAVPVLHSRVPPGDGGISVGQTLLGGLELDLKEKKKP